MQWQRVRGIMFGSGISVELRTNLQLISLLGFTFRDMKAMGYENTIS